MGLSWYCMNQTFGAKESSGTWPSGLDIFKTDAGQLLVLVEFQFLTSSAIFSLTGSFSTGLFVVQPELLLNKHLKAGVCAVQGFTFWSLRISSAKLAPRFFHAACIYVLNKQIVCLLVGFEGLLVIATVYNLTDEKHRANIMTVSTHKSAAFHLSRLLTGLRWRLWEKLLSSLWNVRVLVTLSISISRQEYINWYELIPINFIQCGKKCVWLRKKKRSYIVLELISFWWFLSWV